MFLQKKAEMIRVSSHWSKFGQTPSGTNIIITITYRNVTNRTCVNIIHFVFSNENMRTLKTIYYSTSVKSKEI